VIHPSIDLHWVPTKVAETGEWRRGYNAGIDAIMETLRYGIGARMAYDDAEIHEILTGTEDEAGQGWCAAWSDFRWRMRRRVAARW